MSLRTTINKAVLAVGTKMLSKELEKGTGNVKESPIRAELLQLLKERREVINHHYFTLLSHFKTPNSYNTFVLDELDNKRYDNYYKALLALNVIKLVHITDADVNLYQLAPDFLEVF